MDFFRTIVLFSLTSVLYSNQTIVEDDQIYTEGIYYIDEHSNEIYTNTIVINFTEKIINSNSEELVNNESPYSNSVRTKYSLPHTRSISTSHIVTDTFIADSVRKIQVMSDDNGLIHLISQRNGSIYYFKYDSLLNTYTSNKKVSINSFVLEMGHSEILDSNIVVVWREFTESWNSVIKAQLISFTGDTVGPMVTVSGDFNDGERFHPSVKIINNDSLLFVWSGQEQYGNAIWGQFTDQNLNKIGGHFSIIENNLLGNDHSFHFPTMSTIIENNNYFISWTDDRTGTDKVYGKFFNIDSAITDTSFLIGNENYSCCSSATYDEIGDIYVSYYQKFNDFEGKVVVKKINADGMDLTNHLEISNFTQFTNLSSIKNFEDELIIVWENNETNSGFTQLKGQKISSSLDMIDNEFIISSRSNSLDQINSNFSLLNNNIISTWTEYINGYKDSAWVNIINYNNPPLDNDLDFIPQNISVTLKTFPNPSNSTVQFSILSNKNIYNSKINIYSIIGKKVRQLSMLNIKKGNNYVRWNGKNSENVKLSSGIYIVELTSNNVQVGRNKFLLLK